MDSRAKILAALKAETRKSELPPLVPISGMQGKPLQELFSDTLKGIGGSVLSFESLDQVIEYVDKNLGEELRIISNINLLENYWEAPSINPLEYDNVDVTIIKAHFGVAENGAVWITDQSLTDRVLPFICQDLIVILEKENIVATLHEAYEKIGMANFSFGTFIAGPSKTADIEQSLVLGAHGPKTMTVFLLG